MEGGERSDLLVDVESDDTQKDTGSSDDTDMDSLKAELKETKDKLNEALSEVAVAQVLQENLCSVERQKLSLEEELATMQILLSEATNDSQSNVIDHLKKKYYALREENTDLKIQLNLRDNSAAGQQLQSGAAAGHLTGQPSPASRKPLTDPESLLGVTKTLAKRVKSSVQTVVVMPPITPDKELEDGMMRAREGAEALREIVEPLEEQVSALKGKLRETDSLLQEYERRRSVSLLETEAVSSWLAGGDKKAVEDKLIEEVGDGYSGGEGELFHAMLAARIGMLVQELDSVTWQRDEARSELEVERKKASSLKESAERMQGVVAVTREQLSRVRSQLTDQQKEQLGQLWSAESEAVGGATGETVGERVISAGEWERILARLDSRNSEAATMTEAGEGDEAGQEREELSRLRHERDHILDNCAKYQEDLKAEAAFRKEMEATWNQKGEDYKTQIEKIEEKLRNAELAVSKMNSSYLSLTEASRSDLQTLTKDREKIVRELKRLQAENDSLVGKHSILSEQMASEMINLPDTMEDMQLLLLTYREDLIAAKLGKERAEEKLRNDVGVLKGHLVSEQQGRKAMDKQMRSEIQDLQSKVVILEEVRAELAREKEQRMALAEEMRKLETQQVEARQQKEEETVAASSEKEGMMAEVMELRGKVKLLQTDLDNSVAVQQDFVRLSQSLQMELEKIKSGEEG